MELSVFYTCSKDKNTQVVSSMTKAKLRRASYSRWRFQLIIWCLWERVKNLSSARPINLVIWCFTNFNTQCAGGIGHLTRRWILNSLPANREAVLQRLRAYSSQEQIFLKKSQKNHDIEMHKMNFYFKWIMQYGCINKSQVTLDFHQNNIQVRKCIFRILTATSKLSVANPNLKLDENERT